jgi:hypothetical protein
VLFSPQLVHNIREYLSQKCDTTIQGRLFFSVACHHRPKSSIPSRWITTERESIAMAKSTKTPRWKSFEIAVAQFASAMDPRAHVQWNVRTPDLDTGHPRQRDVWIKATLCGIFPITVLVSCKRHRRKLHEGDIDSFIGELGSSRANLGVIYSFRGFTTPALEKAKARGICCCRLYRMSLPTCRRRSRSRRIAAVRRSYLH